jgi:hypothetical protein
MLSATVQQLIKGSALLSDWIKSWHNAQVASTTRGIAAVLMHLNILNVLQSLVATTLAKQ